MINTLRLDTNTYSLNYPLTGKQLMPNVSSMEDQDFDIKEQNCLLRHASSQNYDNWYWTGGKNKPAFDLKV